MLSGSLKDDRTMIEKQIDLIKKQILKLDDKDFVLDAWKSSTIVILGRIFGDTYQGIKEIEKIKIKSSGYVISDSHFRDKMATCKKQGKEILEACITELETFGQPEQKKIDNSGININLTQNQTVNINLLISALKDELTDFQFRELSALMKADEPKLEKKRRIIEKIKSFGSEVASNILANILTNLNIWG